MSKGDDQKVTKVMTTSIRGDRYTIYLGTQHEINKIVPNSLAFCRSYAKEIYFSFENQELEIIRHEIMHAYIASTHIHEIEELELGAFEEIVCEVVGHYGPKMCSQAKMVKNRMKPLVEEWEKRKKERIRRKREKRKARRKYGISKTKEG